MEVVVIHPGLQLLGAMRRAGIDERVGPFAQQGLDEALSLAVGSWRVGSGLDVAAEPGVFLALALQDLGIGQARGVIDANVQKAQPALRERPA